MIQDRVVGVEEHPDFVEITCESGRAIKTKVLVSAISGWNKKLFPGNEMLQKTIPKINRVFFFQVPEENLIELEKLPTGIIKAEGGMEEFLKSHPDFVN
jgi:hypothetical protein